LSTPPENPNLEKLLKINNKGKTIKNPGKTILGTGVDLNDISKVIPLSIQDADRSGHFGVLGTTRVGKTRLIESIIEQDIRKGYNVAIFDPKGDLDLLNKVVQVAAESGRLEECMLLTPIFPEHSIMLDPLAYYYMEDELVDHAISGIKAKEDYFIAIAQEVTQVVVAGLALRARNRGEALNINFHDVKVRSDYVSLKRFLDAMKMEPGGQEICQNIEQILTSPQDFFSKVSSSLRTTLSALTTGSTGQIIGKCYQNEFVRRFEHGERVILYCNTGSMLARRTAHIIGRVLLSMIQSMVGRFFLSGRKIDPPLCIHMDEGHNMLYTGIQELFNKGGGANVWVHFYTQSIAQVEEEIGREATKSMLDNINTWIYMLVNHPETARYVEESSPLIKRFAPILSFGGGISVREMEENQVLSHKVLTLPKRHFFMRTYGRYYKGMTNDVAPAYVDIRPPSLTSVHPPAPEKASKA
jgi:hypothetical protein